MDKKEQYLDILEALLKKENRFLFDSTLKGKAFRRKLVFQNLLKREITLFQALQIVLPENSKFKNDDIKNRYAEIILKHLFRDYPTTPVHLLEYQVHYSLQKATSKRKSNLFFSCLVELIKEIIIADQYCAKEFIKNDSVVIDAGANIGIFSLFASHLAPKGKIYSFEPTESVFRVLNKNIICNNLQNTVFVYNLALGDKKGEIEIMIQDDALGGPNIISNSDFLKGRELGYNRKESIEITTIDSFVKENKIERVDFIKIDTEGYEKQIIRGASETIKQFSPVISCSAYHLKDDKTEIPKLVKFINSDYKFKLVNKAEEDLIFWV